MILGVIVALVIGAYFYINRDFTDTGELTRVAEEIKERDVQFKPEDKVQLDMEESEVQTYIHHMTHQHVEADKKWGVIESSRQNIENLLTIVQANQDAYEHSDYYIEVLEQWQEGNFNNAVSVHNFIWDLQGGTIGKAKRLLNEEEKRRFAEENFE